MHIRSVSLVLSTLVIGFFLQFIQVQAQDGKATTQPESAESTTTEVPSTIQYKDVSRLAGITFPSVSSGNDINGNNQALNKAPHPRVQAWGDFNNDGWSDLYLIREAGQAKLFVNNRDGTFSLSKLTEKLKSQPDGSPASVQRGATWVDYNNDGWSDLYILVDGQNMLFENLWGHSFVEVAAEAGIADSSQSSSASWGDFNQDGYLDLFIANGSCAVEGCLGVEAQENEAAPLATSRISTLTRRDKLYQSNGYTESGLVTFSDVSYYLNFSGRNRLGRDTSFVDIDADGDLDVYVLNDPNGENESFGGLAQMQGSVGQSSIVIWRNDGAGCRGWCWERDAIMAKAITTDQKALFSPVLNIEAVHFPSDVDLNNDGRVDLLPEEWNINVTNTPVFAMADYDQDGWLDIVAGYHEGQQRLFHNIGSASAESAWLNLRLIGDGYYVNRDAVGTVVTLTTSNGDVWTRTSRVESKRGSSSAGTIHFGLGDSAIRSLHILWPNGKETSLTEDILIYQDTTFTWQIYYPVDLLDSIGGDVISAEESVSSNESASAPAPTSARTEDSPAQSSATALEEPTSDDME